MRRRRLLWWLLGLPLLLLGLAVAGLGFLVHTETGLQWLYRQARELVPGTLEVQRLTGRLGGPLEIRGLDYADGDLALRIDRLSLEWRPAALLRGGLELERLEGEGIRLRLPPGSDDDTPTTPFAGLVLPLRIGVESARVSDLAIATGEAEPTVVDRIALALRGEGRQLHIERLEAAALGADLALDGGLELSAGLPLELNLNWNYRLPDGPQLAGGGTLRGSLRRLDLQQSLTAPLAGNLKGILETLEQDPRWDLRLHLERGEIAPFAAGFPAVLSGELHSAGSPAALTLDGQLTLEEPALGRIDAQLEAGYDGATLSARRLHLETPTGTRIDGSGQWRVSDGGLEAALSWSDLRWPLQGEAVQVQSGAGRLDLKGRPEAYSYALNLDLAAPQVPPLDLEARGDGDLDGLRIETLMAHLLQGQTQGSGRLAWTPALSWELSLQGNGLNPQAVLPQLPGTLELAATTRGTLTDAGPQAELELERLQGRLRDYPVQAGGRVQVRGQELTLQQVAVSSGANRLNAGGTVGETWDLAWKLDAPALDGLWPGLAGRLAATGRLGGSPVEPAMEARIEGRGLAFQGNRIAKLQGDLDLALDRKGRIGLALTATGLASGDLRWSRLGLHAEGVRSAHELRLELTGEQGAPGMDLALSGALEPDDTWQGRIDRLTLEEGGTGRWRLRQPTALTLGAKRLELADACLDGDHGELCLDAKGNPGGAWQAGLHSRRLGLALLRPWLPGELKLDGEGRLDLALHSDAAGRIAGRGLVELPKAGAELALGGTTRTLELSGARLQAELNAKGADADLNLPLGNLGAIEGNMRLPGLALPAVDPAKQPLRGRLHGDVADLAFLSALVPSLSDVRGGIQADFGLAGTLATPQLKGGAELSGGSLDVPELGLQVRELEARVQAPELGRLSYRASARSGDGTLALEGSTELAPERGWPTELHIRGREWVAVDVPEATVQVTPDLTLSHDRVATRLNGELRIPFARLRPRELPASAASDSADLVVVKDGEPVAGEKETLRLHTRVRLVLGDRVSFEGFGLRSRFTGGLELIDEPGRPVLGNGALNIEEGTYQAYGQDLKIERGSALFADSPVDNPGLELRAVRDAGDVTAGIRVGGTLKNPKLTLFSSPTLPQGEIISYLLTGRASGEGGGGSATAALAGAAAGRLTDEVGRQLGLEELRLETGGNLEGASLVAGTWLSPRLYVQYVNELATRETRLRLKYDINKRLQIQTESGSSQGVDLFYTIDR